mgnify:CR=1 FL=1|tara:strand:+ start:606 stop:1190 length:585 start_codon:yes stop_codon:yes gene_type:complete
MSNDFYDISAKMKELFPSNPAADRAALTEMAGAPIKEESPIENINETVSVKKGSMPLDLDLQSFTKLAGINESQKTGSAGQLKGKDSIAKQPAMTTNNPTRDKLVGDSVDNDEESTEAIQIVPTDPSKPFDEAQMQLKRGMSLVEEGSKLIDEAQTKMQEIQKDMMSNMPTEHVSESTKNTIKEELLAKLKARK